MGGRDLFIHRLLLCSFLVSFALSCIDGAEAWTSPDRGNEPVLESSSDLIPNLSRDNDLRQMLFHNWHSSKMEKLSKTGPRWVQEKKTRTGDDLTSSFSEIEKVLSEAFLDSSIQGQSLNGLGDTSLIGQSYDEHTFSAANWNWVFFANCIKELWQNPEGSILDNVERKLRKQYNGFIRQISKARSDIEIYMEGLDLWGYVKFLQKARIANLPTCDYIDVFRHHPAYGDMKLVNGRDKVVIFPTGATQRFLPPCDSSSPDITNVRARAAEVIQDLARKGEEYGALLYSDADLCGGGVIRALKKGELNKTQEEPTVSVCPGIYDFLNKKQFGVREVDDREVAQYRGAQKGTSKKIKEIDKYGEGQLRFSDTYTNKNFINPAFVFGVNNVRMEYNLSSSMQANYENAPKFSFIFAALPSFAIPKGTNPYGFRDTVGLGLVPDNINEMFWGNRESVFQPLQEDPSSIYDTISELKRSATKVSKKANSTNGKSNTKDYTDKGSDAFAREVAKTVIFAGRNIVNGYKESLQKHGTKGKPGIKSQSDIDVLKGMLASSTTQGMIDEMYTLYLVHQFQKIFEVADSLGLKRFIMGPIGTGLFGHKLEDVGYTLGYALRLTSPNLKITVASGNDEFKSQINTGFKDAGTGTLRINSDTDTKYGFVDAVKYLRQYLTYHKPRL